MLEEKGTTALDMVIRKSLIEEVTIDQRPDRDKEKSACISGLVWKGEHIGPGAGVCLLYLRKRRKPIGLL